MKNALIIFAIVGVQHCLSATISRDDDFDSNVLSPPLQPECSRSKFDTITSCLPTQQCGRNGVSFPLDSCLLRWFAEDEIVNNVRGIGCNTIFRFQPDGTNLKLVGTFRDSHVETGNTDIIIVDLRYSNNLMPPPVDVITFFELHPYYFSDLKMRITPSATLDSGTFLCTDFTADSNDCGGSGKSQFFCPVYVRLFHASMCNKCYKATFGVKGKQSIQVNIVKTVEKYVKIAGRSSDLLAGFYYNISNEVAEGIVSEVCFNSCSFGAQNYCKEGRDDDCTRVSNYNGRYPRAVHEYMYMRELDCDNLQEIEEPVCQMKSIKGGLDRYRSTNVVFNPDTGQPQCDCAMESLWDDIIQECELVCDKIGCTGANEIPGSCEGYFDKRNSKCSCVDGFTWDSTRRRCRSNSVMPPTNCTMVCGDVNAHCAFWPVNGDFEQRCVCNEGYTQPLVNGECVSFSDWYD